MDDDAPLRRFFRNWLPRRPTDAVCLGLAVAGAGFILVNALFLQSGRHPAPIFTEVAQRCRADDRQHSHAAAQTAGERTSDPRRRCRLRR